MPHARASLACVVVALMTAACSEPAARSFIDIRAPRIAIVDVRVIDGSGAPARERQTVLIEDGRIRAVDRVGAITVPQDALVIDGRGRTLFPGLVGMHEHLFYQQTPKLSVPAQAAFARLYLAAGVTTIRTAGSVNFSGDLRVKQQIDSGRLPGPAVHVTGPYLHPRGPEPDPDGIAREVYSQADRGATSLKAYMGLRSSELKAAIDAAHAPGLRMTGHLCAVGFREAAALGIDNLEHGFIANSEFVRDKQPDACPDQSESIPQFVALDVARDVRVQRTFEDLIRHGVAVTSTLAIYESFTGRDSTFDRRTPGVLAGWLRKPYEAARDRWSDPDAYSSRVWATALRKEMQLERAFVEAGGLLLAGVDPTGWGALVAGFGDQRQLELLVQASLSPEMAIRVASANGAKFLNEIDRIGTIEPGKQADLVLVRGNPSLNIADVKHVEAVFRNGVGYNPDALIAATQGAVGGYSLRRFRIFPYNILVVVVLALLLAAIVVRPRRKRPSAVATPTAPASAAGR